MNEKTIVFPVGLDFLELTQGLADKSSEKTDKFCYEAGESLPKTIGTMGTVLSILYRLACCYYGCREGDHQIEWLVAKFVSQAVSAHRLIRAAQYDESLMLIRGIGEIVNLLWLFQQDQSELTAWKCANKKIRISQFGPAAVRGRLEKTGALEPPIDSERYSALCEIASHPTPGLAPGHYSGTGRPVLGAVVQEVGVFVCVNELAFAIAMGASPIAALLDSDNDLKKQLKELSINLLRSIGSFTVLNYEEGLRKVFEQHTRQDR